MKIVFGIFDPVGILFCNYSNIYLDIISNRYRPQPTQTVCTNYKLSRKDGRTD